MRIKIRSRGYAREHLGPYKLLEIVERTDPLSVGENTNYGTIVSILPPIPPFTEDADQSVSVEGTPSLMLSDVEEEPRKLYPQISIHPIRVERNGFLEPDAIRGSHVIMADEGLSIEDVSVLLTGDTFSTWKQGCFLAKRDIDNLEGLRYALVHRYSTRDRGNEEHSTELLNLANACLSLIRPTRKSRAGIITGLVKDDGTLDPHGFGLVEFVEVPMIQRLFSVRTRDVSMLQQILPRFINLYRKDSSGRMKDDYEPIRMAVQLYEQGYANSYWKARHILWWSAIEALYGNAEDSAMARIYSFLGNKDIARGYDTSIYEPGDVPSCYSLTPSNNHTLGEVLPLIYEVRNSAAHGQKVADPHFASVSHPFEGTAPLLDVLAEAATFIIRKTVVGILDGGLCEDFKEREAREKFWLYQYGLDNRQSKKRLHELKAAHRVGLSVTT